MQKMRVSGLDHVFACSYIVEMCILLMNADR